LITDTVKYRNIKQAQAKKSTLSKQRIITLISEARQVRPTQRFAQRDTSYW